MSNQPNGPRTALERLPKAEMERRHVRIRDLLPLHAPEADGLLVFSRLNIYYLTGTWGNGVVWLPRQGSPVLMARRGIERAKLESPMENILPFRSYKDLPGVCREAGSPLAAAIAAEMNGLPWAMGEKLKSALPGATFVSGDFTLSLARAVKTQWELAKMRLAGQRHHLCLHQLLPQRIRPGMTERRISHAAWEIFFAQGHGGALRMGAFGEEAFLGHVAAGDSANYPSVFNGPVGLRGEHPALPLMGNAGKVWRAHEPLCCDIGFCLEGYMTDKTQVYTAEKLPKEACEAHAFCIDVQAWLSENLKPGASPAQLYRHCVEWAERAGFSDGFMALDGNKVKFLGHGIGLAVDEFPAVADKVDIPLEAGMVLALEPKIGLRGLGMVGVENTFEVTDAGGVGITGDQFDMVSVGSAGA